MSAFTVCGVIKNSKKITLAFHADNAVSRAQPLSNELEPKFRPRTKCSEKTHYNLNLNFKSPPLSQIIYNNLVV